jgi:hypothetical protein
LNILFKELPPVGHAKPKLLHQKPWTPEEDDALRKAIEDGVSRQRLSARFKRPVRAIEVRATKLGLSFKAAPRLAHKDRV